MSSASRMTERASGTAEVRARYDGMAATELAGAGRFESLTPAKRYFRTRKLETALRLGGFPAQGRLLEIGCSVGQFTFSFARLGYRICGMDLSPHSIEVAKQRANAEGISGATFVTGEAEALTLFADDTFDGVVSFSTLRYVDNLPKALSEIVRVLKPGGRAVIDVPNRWCPWFYMKPWLGSERHPHDHWLTSTEVSRLVRRAGFREVQLRHLLFTPTVTPDRWLPLFQGIDWIGERLPLVRRFAGILMVSAQKP
jgi:SAM-dependent methyltransferase